MQNSYVTLPLFLLTLALAALTATAQVPGLLSHQGKVTVAGTNYTGAGSFKFALVNAAGDTTYWSNDGTSSAGSQPAAAVSLAVARGVFSVNLGDTSLTNMTQAIPASAFSTDAVYLRVWFNDGVNGSQLLTPDRRVTSVAYALQAASAPETEPLFTNSVAAAITSGQTNNWTTAYGWGNHASAGYLTSYTETDPVFGASAAHGIAAGDITHWTTAYGWGNHATAGYLTSYTETDPLFAASAAHGIAASDITAWNAKIGGSGTASYVPKFTASGTVGNSALFSDASGNVGIGTTTPASKFQVYGTETGANWAGRGVFGGANNAVVLGQYNNKAYFGAYNGTLDGWSDLTINPGGGNVLLANGGGRVGIGTETPLEALQVGEESGGSPTARKAIKIGSGGYSEPGGYQTNANGDKLILYNNDGLDARIGIGGGCDMWFKVIGSGSGGKFRWLTENSSGVPTERMRIDNGGHVGIGTTAPGYTLHVNGSVAGTSAYNNLSDARLKKDVQPIGDALSIVGALRGVTFNWDQAVDPTMKLDDRNHVGFLAQEVEKVLPQAVSTANDVRQTKSVAYSEVIPVLNEAIKQQQTQIESLKAENDTLKARLDAIEAKLGK